MKIGVVSDTHMPRRSQKLPMELWTAFAGVDLILHAGDLVDEGVLDILKTIAPVEAVAGNTDPRELHWKLGRKKVLALGGKNVGLIHGDGMGGSTPERARLAFAEEQPDCVVFGHSHQAFNQVVGGMLMFNPGSCTDPRWGREPSFGILTIDDGIRGKIRFINDKCSL